MELQALSNMLHLFPDTPKIPVLFIGHGSPMNAIEENEFVEGWKKVAQEIPKPAAILCISAHWETRGTFVTGVSQPKTIHDFGGFPQALFDVQYPAPGHPELAQATKALITTTEVELDKIWGLDHGCWSVLVRMYPEADIPVIQMSMDITRPTAYHFELGRQLNRLRRKGVLILGSGNMVHNLRILDWQTPDSGYDWAAEANEIFKQKILNEDYSSLNNIRSVSQVFRLAVPSYDHYHPMIYVLGLKEKNEHISFFNDKLVMGSLSMTSLMIS